MAQLKDLIVAGPARIIGTLYAQDASTTVAGLVKLGGGTTNFLRADGTWAAPPGTLVAATATPLMDGTAAVGSSAKYAKEDHIHPTDTSRAPLASPALTGTPTAPTATAGTNTTQIATTAFVTAAVKVVTDSKGAANGIAPLNSSGIIDNSYLPSYVDDVVEYSSQSNFPATGETGKIYVATDTNKTWRWSGSAYVEISPGASLNHTHTVTATGNVSTVTATTVNKTADVTTASGTTTYTPGGTVGTPTISLKTAGTTTTVPNVTNAGTVPTLESTNKTVVTGTSVANEVLSFITDNATMVTNWNAGTTPTLGTAITVKNGDAAYQSSQPTWTGTGVRLVTGNIPVPATYTSTFTGTSATTSTPSA